MRHGPAALLNAKEYSTNSSRTKQAKKLPDDDGFVRLTDGKVVEKNQDILLGSLESAERVSSNLWKAPNDWAKP